MNKPTSSGSKTRSGQQSLIGSKRGSINDSNGKHKANKPSIGCTLGDRYSKLLVDYGIDSSQTFDKVCPNASGKGSAQLSGRTKRSTERSDLIYSIEREYAKGKRILGSILGDGVHGSLLSTSMNQSKLNLTQVTASNRTKTQKIKLRTQVNK